MTRLALGVAQPVLLGADDAFHHGVDGFQVAGVGRQRDLDLAARWTCAGCRWRPGGTSRRRSPASSPGRRCLRTRRRSAPCDLPMRLASTLRRPRWAMPMTISCTPAVGRAFQQLVENRHGALAAFEREALLPHEARVEEVLELFGLQERSAECAAFGSRSSGQWLACGSMRCCSQRFSSGMLDVHVLAADACRSRSGAGFRGSRAAWRRLGAFADGWRGCR